MDLQLNTPRPRVFAPVPDAPTAFHRALPGYAVTPLVTLPELAGSLGVKAVYVKDETHRLGLPAFKILGASWAVHRLLRGRRRAPASDGSARSGIPTQADDRGSLTLVTATDGNHGRAVASAAAQVGVRARIAVPRGTAAARIAAIESEGAEVTIVDGGYDDAVAEVATWASPDHLIVSDTSWPGYEQVPGWIAEGYSTLFREIDDQLSTLGERPAMVAVPIGVGALALAAVRHFRPKPVATSLLGVEPSSAACVLSSARAGAIVREPGPHRSVMVGLNCGTPSMIAWPEVRDGFDAFTAIEDDGLPRALRLLGSHGIAAGETGAATVAALLELAGDGPAAGQAREHLRLAADSVVVALCTEGATDPATRRDLIARA